MKDKEEILQDLERDYRQAWCTTIQIVLQLLILFFVFLMFISTLAGCGSMKGEAYKITRSLKDPNYITIEYYKASHETLLVDWERYGFYGRIKGFGQVGSDKARVESEGAEIMEDATGAVDPLRKVVGQ